MMLALYVAFWLQLGGASTAATCVGILSLPTRGQMLQKAVYRIAGTVIGLTASFAIAGLFNGVRDLLLFASGAWISLCVLAAGLLDGNRAYAAVLSGYTVSIVTVVNIDSPQDVFESGVNRGAAIIIGICAISLCSALLFNPELLPKLIGKFEAAHGKVRATLADTLRAGRSDPVEIAKLFGEIAALRPDSTLLPLERLTGDTRSAAAQNASVTMVQEIAAGRYTAATLASISGLGHSLRDDLAAFIKDGPGQNRTRLVHRIEAAFTRRRLNPSRLIAASAGLMLLERDRSTRAALRDLRDGGGKRDAVNPPIWRSRENAVRNAVRNLIAFEVVAALFVAFSGWPATSGALDALGAVIGLSAVRPDPSTVAFGGVIAVPLAALAAGLTQFVFLDGADQFPLLVLAMGPTIIAASLITMSGNPKLAPIGTLLITLFPIQLAPANPQNYDAETFLSSNALVMVSVVLSYLCLATVLPTDDKRRRRWILRSAWKEFRRVVNGQKDRNGPAAAAYRDADRISQLGALKGESEEAHRDSVTFALRLSDIASCYRRMQALHADPALLLPQEASELRLALANLDPARLIDVARPILERSQQSPHGLAGQSRQLVAEIMLAAGLIERYQPGIDEFCLTNHLPGIVAARPAGTQQELRPHRSAGDR